jgi:CRISPR system Cascade subunit CasA
VKLPFSVALVLPPLDLNHSAIAAAEARREEAGHHLESVVAADQTAIDAAIVESAAARTALSRIRADELPTARNLAHQADSAMDQGAIDRVDWAAAQAGEQLSELAEIDALRRVHAGDAALEDALRRPLEGPELMLANPQGDKQ